MTARIDPHAVAAVGRMRAPLPTRIIFTFMSLSLPLGAHIADMAYKTHIYNDNWPPYAKFHGGQTLAFSILLGLFTLYFTWAKTSDKTISGLAMCAFASVYSITQALAIVYPGTAFFDPGSPAPRLLGIALQLWIDVFALALTSVGGWFALRKNARWS